MTQLPPPPPGFQLDAPANVSPPSSGGTTPPPPGFQIDQAAAPTAPPAVVPQPQAGPDIGGMFNATMSNMPLIGPAYQAGMQGAGLVGQMANAAPPGPNERRGDLAPIIRNNDTGALRLAAPQMAMDIGNALKLPGDVASGKTPVDLNNPSNELIGRGLGLATLAGSAGGMAAKGMVGPILNGSAQRAATNTALRMAPTAAELKDMASSAFESATGGKPIGISDNAYFRFMGDVQAAVQKYRPNAANDPQSVGLLEHLKTLGDDANTPGVMVDLKDLHLARQLAQKVAQSSNGRDSAIGTAVIHQMDNFVKNLKPSDIPGGADPHAAANSLMAGISGWAKAKKVGVIEDAIGNAQVAASGVENGLRTQFRKLISTQEARKQWTPAEINAIEQVVNGSTGTAFIRLLGRFGFPTGAKGGNNMLGGSIAGAIGSGAGALLGGPLAPVTAGIGGVLTPAVGTVMRRVSENITSRAANRAAQVAGLQNIPIPARQLSRPLVTGAGALSRGDLLSQLLQQSQNGGGGGY